MKVVIAGAGEIGTYLAKMLSDGNHDTTVIDTDEEKLQLIDDQFDLLTVSGSATSLGVLKQAAVQRADLFIALMEEQAVNITAAIMSKKLGTKKTIARINNKEYLDDDNRAYLKTLGIDSLIYPEILASREIASLLRQSGTNRAYDFCGGQLSLYVIRLEEKAPVANKSLIDAADIAKQSYRVIAITRDGHTIIPRGEDVLQAGDMMHVVTNKGSIDSILWYAGKTKARIKNIMIMGGSRIGQNTARAFQKNTNVKLLELIKEKSFQIADELNDTLVLHADGKDIEFLKSEGIKRMDAFIAVTGSTDTNILSCLLAKRLGVKRTIAEIENIDYIDLAENMGVDTIINKKRIAASHIFSFTEGEQVASLQYLTGTEAEVLEFDVSAGAKILHKNLNDTQFPKGSIVGGVVRGKESFIATGKTHIQEGDKVVVFALPQAVNKVIKLFS